jgi:hypothetical protein
MNIAVLTAMLLSGLRHQINARTLEQEADLLNTSNQEVSRSA